MRSKLYLTDQLFFCCSWVRKFDTNFVYNVQEEFDSSLFQFSTPKFNSSTTSYVYSLTKFYQNCSIISEEKGAKTSHLPIMSSFQALSVQKAQKQVVWRSVEHARLL